MRLSRRLPIVLTLLCLVPAGSGTASAWSREGHMVTAAVTYQVLRDTDPEALRSALELLTHHPHYRELLEPPADWDLDAQDREIAVLMRAARWADDVRSGPFESYSRPSWHYVNYHYRPPVLTSPALEGDGDLLAALRENTALLAGPGDAAERAVALTWLFHLVGDSHQPLHTIALHTADHPDGDRGGNLVYLRARPGADTINLHAFWDNLLIGTDDFRAARNRATELRARLGAEVAPDAEIASYSRWAAEGAALATETVYLRGELRGGDSEDGALLPAGYAERAQPAAERRAVLSGYRMARLLSRTLRD